MSGREAGGCRPINWMLELSNKQRTKGQVGFAATVMSIAPVPFVNAIDEKGAPVMANQQSQKKYRFTPKPIDLDELLEAFEWAVENLVPYNGVTCLFGKPGAFKTFLAIALAWCKAIGMKFCGRWVGPPCKVLYIAAD